METDRMDGGAEGFWDAMAAAELLVSAYVQIAGEGRI